MIFNRAENTQEVNPSFPGLILARQVPFPRLLTLQTVVLNVCFELHIFPYFIGECLRLRSRCIKLRIGVRKLKI